MGETGGYLKGVGHEDLKEGWGIRRRDGDGKCAKF